MATARVDWRIPRPSIEYLVDYSRVLAGGRRPFDDAATRDLARRDVERARDFPAAQNHDVLCGGRVVKKPLSSIGVPTLVIHGTADPMFPIEHGQALAREIPGARLLPLEGAGHGVERADWEIIVRRDPRSHRGSRRASVRMGGARLERATSCL